METLKDVCSLLAAASFVIGVVLLAHGLAAF